MTKFLRKFIWTTTEGDLLRERKFIEEQINEIGEDNIRNLVEVSVKYRKNAYTLYSHYDVGAAIHTVDGQVFGACNSESASYSPSNHAEGTAIAKANSEGLGRKHRKYIKAVAVCHDGDSGPCGECLQRIVEHADNCLIIVANPQGKIRRITSLLTIFPYNFNPSHLGK